jgi:polynucleotide 5'-kinase involved in rRNA processing
MQLVRSLLYCQLNVLQLILSSLLPARHALKVLEQISYKRITLVVFTTPRFQRLQKLQKIRLKRAAMEMTYTH